MSAMIERVALAILDALNDTGCRPKAYTWDEAKDWGIIYLTPR